MKSLQLVQDSFFNTIYKGKAVRCNSKKSIMETIEVICILDDNCVRYTVRTNGKQTSKREYNNNQKELCLANATKALNK